MKGVQLWRQVSRRGVRLQRQAVQPQRRSAAEEVVWQWRQFSNKGILAAEEAV